jgi:hypothetical protein
VTTETIPNTRAAQRAHLVERVREMAAEQLTAIEGGPLDGIEVLSAGKLEEVLAAVGTEVLPPLDLHTAEVVADSIAAIVLVWAACPRCGVRQLLTAEITPRLTIDPTSTELSLRARSKARGHICGQLPIQVGPDGQGSFELDDIIGTGEPGEGIEVPPDGTTAELVVEPCPFPGCGLAADHRGDHIVPPVAEP